MKSSAWRGCFFFATDDLCLLALWGFFTGLRFFRFLGFSLILIPNCSGGLGADIPDTAFIGFSGTSGTGVSDRYSVLRWMSQRTQLTANSESESPSNPITPKIPSGRDTRHKMMIRVVREKGNLIMGTPVNKTSTQASIALRARIMPPNKRPLVRKFGGI